MQQNIVIAISILFLSFANSVSAEFTHKEFNSSKISEIIICEPKSQDSNISYTYTRRGEEKIDFIRKVIPTKLVIKDKDLLKSLHHHAKTDKCYVPHLKYIKEDPLCFVTYVDSDGEVIGIIRLWSDGRCHYKTGHKHKSGLILLGLPSGKGGPCSCGKLPDLALEIKKLMNKK